MIRLAGWASTPAIDQEDCAFQHKSIVIPKAMPPLFASHRDGELGRAYEPAGRILNLEWRPQGMWAEVVVEDRYAEYKAFSVGCKLEAYEIIGKGKTAYAQVTRASLTELSITNNPCNVETVVVTRAPYNPIDLTPFIKAQAAYTDTIVQKFAAIQRHIRLLEALL